MDVIAIISIVIAIITGYFTWLALKRNKPNLHIKCDYIYIYKRKEEYLSKGFVMQCDVPYL